MEHLFFNFFYVQLKVKKTNLFLGFCLEIISTDPYLCSCISNMVKKCHSLFKAEDDFWYLILSIVNNTIKNSNSKKSTIDCTSLFGFDDANTAISFSWWWIRKLVE